MGKEIKLKMGEASIHMQLDLAQWDVLATSIAVTIRDTRKGWNWLLEQMGEKVAFE